MSIEDARKRREAPLDAPSNLGSNATKDISAALTVLLADVFALYVKTKNFHWHTSGPHFRDYHLLLDEQAAQIFATKLYTRCPVTASTPKPEGGARCVSSARRDLCGGRGVILVPCTLQIAWRINTFC